MASDARAGHRGWTAGEIASHVAIVPVALAFLFPFFWMISNAVRDNAEVLVVPPRLLPSTAHWRNFLDAWLYLPFGRFFLNSTVASAGVTVVVLLVSSLAGYAFARLRFRFSGTLFALYMATLMVPQVVLVVPLFLMMSALGWVNTYQGLVLPMAFSSFGTFLLRQFFLQIPAELEEAARMDGASRLRILLSIVLPLATPALGLLALFTFTAQWNNFLWALIITNGSDHATLPLGLTLFQGQHGSQWNYLMAGATISVLPGLILTILLQKYVFRGLALTSGLGGR